MRNRKDSKIQKILGMAGKLPLFTLSDLASMETDRNYLKILLSRHVKMGSVIRLKKGIYVTSKYVDAIEKAGRLTAYAEFLSGVLYVPSYLSLEYVLYKHGVLTESPVYITAISINKTAAFSTNFGNYQYHSIAPRLFTGFATKKDGDLYVFTASKSKALFDFIYLRKRHLVNEEAILELRLNLESFNGAEKKEFASYVALEGSKLMKIINKNLWKK